MVEGIGPVTRAKVVVVFLAACGLSGCVEPTDSPRLNAPSLGEREAVTPLTDYAAYHIDQAMMADRSIADIHFVPETSDLSGTGVARLERYAELLATTGGTLRYAPTTDDQALIEERLAAAKRFLGQAVPGGKTIDVVVGLAGGRGMSAEEAIVVKKNAQAKAEGKSASGSGP